MSDQATGDHPPRRQGDAGAGLRDVSAMLLLALAWVIWWAAGLPGNDLATGFLDDAFKLVVFIQMYLVAVMAGPVHPLLPERAGGSQAGHVDVHRHLLPAGCSTSGCGRRAHDRPMGPAGHGVVHRPRLPAGCSTPRDGGRPSDRPASPRDARRRTTCDPSPAVHPLIGFLPRRFPSARIVSVLQQTRPFSDPLPRDIWLGALFFP